MDWLTFFQLVIYFVTVNANVIVDTKSGKVAGKEVASIIQSEKYYSFLGIPYAQPPIGELRFMSPIPHEGWTDTLEAKKEKSACSQFYLPVRKVSKVGFFGDEDCLYLSIHTPKSPQPDLKLPSIVFLYNEQFRLSSNVSKEYGPDFFMAENVIIITVQHRLGALGFLSFEDEVLPGNYGVKDVIMALKWIQDNISYFGGDPSKVTLLGSQGGGAMADILLQSPKAKGLMSGVILHSGTTWHPQYIDPNPKKKAKALGEALDEVVTTSSYLKKRLGDYSAQVIAESEHYAVHADDSRKIQRGIVAFGPSIEPDHPDAIITTYPEDRDIEINLPVMIGYNSREGIELTERFLEKPQYLTFADRDFLLLFPRRVKYNFKINDKVYFKAVDKVKEFYFDEAYVKISKPGEYISYVSDIMTFYSVDYAVRKYANISTNPVYYYVFDYNGELNLRKKNSLKNSISIDGTWGASVSDELCYMFVCNPKKVYKTLLEDEDAEEIKVIKNVVKMWANFARTGNPTPPGEDFNWKPATKENKECLVISDELQIKENLNEDVVKFWDEFITHFEEMAINNIVQDQHDEL